MKTETTSKDIAEIKEAIGGTLTKGGWIASQNSTNGNRIRRSHRIRRLDFVVGNNNLHRHQVSARNQKNRGRNCWRRSGKENRPTPKRHRRTTKSTRTAQQAKRRKEPMKQEDNGFPKQSDAVHCMAVQRASKRVGSEIKARTNLEDEK